MLPIYTNNLFDGREISLFYFESIFILFQLYNFFQFQQNNPKYEYRAWDRMNNELMSSSTRGVVGDEGA